MITWTCNEENTVQSIHLDVTLEILQNKNKTFLCPRRIFTKYTVGKINFSKGLCPIRRCTFTNNAHQNKKPNHRNTGTT
ncbi:hypothetical protein I79_018865 [Cricetulus griseus]|uniref:Uncharacterized protein n=1 Tax=Cricetulus griseus TaxID=10029 RepID=G3I5V7_CRIGR|nr:hypothetical protein I79_018865 [Cricetulus griseus]